MRDSRLKKLGSLLATVSISILVFLLLSFLVSPARSTFKESQTFAVFNEVWQTVNDNFYDPRFNGVDWKAMRQKYEPWVKQAQCIDEASVVINRMLSELNTSHTHFYTKSETAYYQLLGIFNAGSWKEIKKFFPDGKLEYTEIGVFTKEINGKTFVTAILDGSPAEPAGLKVGDRVLAIDGNLLYLAVVDVFVNGERLEGKGVTPDIEVPFQLEYAQGKAPQKEKAVEVLVEAVVSLPE